MKIALQFALLLACDIMLASECLHVKVSDNDGNPVTNAFVHIRTEKAASLPSWGKDGDDADNHYKAQADTNGFAAVRFKCVNGIFHWHVEADGYYSGDEHREVFRHDATPVPPAFFNVRLHEHNKEVTEVLWRKINQQPMYKYGIRWAAKVPEKDGRYGFDLKLFDWIAPHGKGEVADFYFVRAFTDERSRDGEGFIGYMEFENKCGAYIKKKSGNKVFPGVYCVDTNADFKSRIPFVFSYETNGVKQICYKNMANGDECMILRTRVRTDDRGCVLEANYSMILGPFQFRGLPFGCGMATPCSIFNPRVNDINLESDPARNLYRGKKGYGIIP